jgi:hypothetical protein
MHPMAADGLKGLAGVSPCFVGFRAFCPVEIATQFPQQGPTCALCTQGGEFAQASNSLGRSTEIQPYFVNRRSDWLIFGMSHTSAS